LYYFGYIISIKRDYSATQKSAKVKYPITKSFFPTKSFSWRSLGLYFSKTEVFAVGYSLLINSLLIYPEISMKTERKLSILERSSIVLPKSYNLPQRLIIYFWIAVVSVIVVLPSKR